MSILGSIIVELKAQTASFIDGMNAAAKSSSKAGHEIEASFSKIGGLAATALAPFGEFGSAIALTLGAVGSHAGSAVASLGKMGGVLGGMAVVGGGAAAALGAVSAGALGLAIHTAKGIAEMGELAQSSGIAVGPLSGLAFVFKATGVNVEAGVKAIEKFDKTIFKAATSSAGTVTIFDRMHISLKNSNGTWKETDQLFGEVAGKLAGMKDGWEKSALAQQLFSKGGAVLIPALNKGKEGIEDLIATAKVLGVYLDDATVAAAEKFKESLATIEAIGSGLAIRLTRELLPALQTVANFLLDGFKDKQSGINDVIDGVVFLTKAFIGVGETIWSALKQVGLFVGNSIAYFAELFDTLAQADARASKFDFSGAVDAWREGRVRMKAIDEELVSGSKKIWADNAAFIKGVFGKLDPAKPSAHKRDDTDLTPQDKSNVILDTIAKLRAQMELQGRLATSISDLRANTILYTAAAEAEKTITELQIRAKEKHLAVSLAQENEIRRIITLTAAYKAGFEDNKALQDFIFKTETQTKSVLQLADAYSTANPELIENAEAMAKLAPFQKDADDLTQVIENLRAMGASDKDLAPLIVSLDQLHEKLSIAAVDADQLKFAEHLKAAGQAVAASQPQEQTASRISDLELLKARESEFGRDTSAIDALLYQEKIRHVEEYMQYVFQTQNAEILGNARIHDSQDGLIRQWDEAVFKVGSFRDKFQGIMNELILQGRHAGEAIAGAFLTAIDGAETQLAKLLTGQKANFKQVFQGLAEQVTKAQIQSVVGKIAERFGLSKGSKPDGTPSNPLHVVLQNGLPGVTNASGSPAGTIGDVFHKVGGFFGHLLGLGKNSLPFSAGGAPTAVPGVVGATGPLDGFSFGSGGLAGLFGGALASGGDVRPGKAYLVGEKHPELFTPGVHGHVSPSIGGSRGPVVHQTNNFHLTQPADFFRRGDYQIQRHVGRAASLAYGRA